MLLRYDIKDIIIKIENAETEAGILVKGPIMVLGFVTGPSIADNIVDPNRFNKTVNCNKPRINSDYDFDIDKIDTVEDDWATKSACLVKITTITINSCHWIC